MELDKLLLFPLIFHSYKLNIHLCNLLLGLFQKQLTGFARLAGFCTLCMNKAVATIIRTTAASEVPSDTMLEKRLFACILFSEISTHAELWPAI